MRDTIARCLDRVAEDDDLTVVLRRGAGGAFSTGADMDNAYGCTASVGSVTTPAGARGPAGGAGSPWTASHSASTTT